MLGTLELKESSVAGETAQGELFQGHPVRLDRFQLVFELHQPGDVLRASERIDSLKITLHGKTLYAGSAVVVNLLDTGHSLFCEASLDQGSWRDVELSGLGSDLDRLGADLSQFIREIEKYYHIESSYKILAADIQILLGELRLWLEQVEVGIRGSPTGDRARLEYDIADRLQPVIFPILDHTFEKLETSSAKLDESIKPAHRTYIQRQLHPHVLCSPFAFRSIHKPLGYAGDYEIVNMLLRDPHEGSSLFAKMLNRWFIKQPPAQAHRNRIQYLTQCLIQETARILSQGRMARIYNLGCGPAQEIQWFLERSEASHQAKFTLLDFSEETLSFVQKEIEQVRQQFQRRTSFNFQKKAVAQVLKGKSKSVAGDSPSHFDLIYCAGLFDYLSDVVCKQLMNHFYNMLAPGGLLLVTNVDASNPIRHWLGDILEWHLIYRNTSTLRALRPDHAASDQIDIRTDPTGVNLFMEVRKPSL